MSDIHSCSYHCTRPECIKEQRDYLRDRFIMPMIAAAPQPPEREVFGRGCFREVMQQPNATVADGLAASPSDEGIASATVAPQPPEPEGFRDIADVIAEQPKERMDAARKRLAEKLQPPADIVLPPLPDFPLYGPLSDWANEHARAAVLMDRERRG